MIIIDTNLEWNIPSGSFLQMLVVSFKWVEKKITTIPRWVEVYGIFEKVSAKSAIGRVKEDPKHFRISTPGGVVITFDKDNINIHQRLKCRKIVNRNNNNPNNNPILCSGYINVEGKNRVCEKCRSEYQYNPATKDWGLIEYIGPRLTNKKVSYVDSLTGKMYTTNKYSNEEKEKERDEFISGINNNANKFKMVATGCQSFDRNNRIRNHSNLPKEINMKKKAKGYYGGKYRIIEYELLGSNEVNILCIYLDEVELEEGDDMAQIEGDRLRTKKYSGEMPSEVYYYNIAEVEGVVVPPTRKVICARCQKVYIIGEEAYQKLGFCSEKCEQKDETKIAKSAMKAAVNRGNKNSRVLS